VSNAGKSASTKSACYARKPAPGSHLCEESGAAGTGLREACAGFFDKDAILALAYAP